jgi:predicted Rossmann fold nucleotide-binding protein DprA/Smf involved in DNA uptake
VNWSGDTHLVTAQARLKISANNVFITCFDTSSVLQLNTKMAYERVHKEMLDKLGSEPYNDSDAHTTITILAREVCDELVRHHREDIAITRDDFFWLADAMMWERLCKITNPSYSRRAIY